MGKANRGPPPCPQPTSGSQGRRGEGSALRPGPRILGRAPGTKRPFPPPLPPLPAAARHVLRLVHQPRPRPRLPLAVPHLSPLPPSPRDWTRLGLHVTRGGQGHAARAGSLIGSPGRSQPRLPSVARPEGDEIGIRGKGERLRWSERRAGIMKKKAKVKPLVEGKELQPKRAYDTDSSRRQSGDTGGRGWASSVAPHLARHVSHLPPAD